MVKRKKGKEQVLKNEWFNANLNENLFNLEPSFNGDDLIKQIEILQKSMDPFGAAKKIQDMPQMNDSDEEEQITCYASEEAEFISKKTGFSKDEAMDYIRCYIGFHKMQDEGETNVHIYDNKLVLYISEQFGIPNDWARELIRADRQYLAKIGVYDSRSDHIKPYTLKWE